MFEASTKVMEVGRSAGEKSTPSFREGRELTWTMSDKHEKKTGSVRRPDYVPPRVVFHSREEILRTAGPAIGCARWNIIQQLGQEQAPKRRPS